MAKLDYTFKNDVLFKKLFVDYPELLKRLVAEVIQIRFESIEQFEITNPEILPESLGEKFCRLDINMIVDGHRIDLEVQVQNEGNYPERSLYHWAREYSSALKSGQEYTELPRVVIISILAFKLFACAEFHSEFRALEVTRHTPLTDKMSLHYFELPKLPKTVNMKSKLELWLKLFDAETEEDLKEIEGLGVVEMQQAIGAYRTLTETDRFKILEQMRRDARHNEASALGHARREAYREADVKWEGVVAEKDAVVAEQAALIAELRARLGEKK